MVAICWLEKGTYLIGLIGLNEAMHYLTGFQLMKAMMLYVGLKTVSFLHLKCKDYSKKTEILLSLESPAESAAGRLAKIDLREFQKAKKIKEAEQMMAVIILIVSILPLPTLTLSAGLKNRASFTLIKSGAIIHAFVGEKKPPADSIYNLICKVWKIQLRELPFHRSFRSVTAVRKSGVTDFCSHCHSNDVYGITRIVGYYSKIKNWNKNKIGELKDRKSGNYQIT